VRPALRRRLSEWFINRNFGLFVVGTFLSGTGYWFLLVSLGWLVLELSDSTFVLGLATFAQMAPMFVLGVFGGLLADRFNRKTIMVAAQGVVVAANLVLALAASADRMTVPLILACSLVLGIANSVLWPTWSVFIKDLVGPAHVRRAVAMNAMRFNLTRVIGPALAGVMLARVGPAWCLWVGLIGSLGIIATIYLLRLPAWHPPPPATRSVLGSIGEGIGVAWRTPPVRRLLLVTGVIGAAALPFQAFLPAVTRETLRAGPEVLGLLTAAVGLGAILGALTSGHRLATSRPSATLIGLCGGIGLGLALLAVGQHLWLTLLALGILGLTTIAFLSIANASVQLGVPDQFIGRVMGLWVVLNAGTQPLGSLAEGAIAERFGLGATFGLAALICGGVVLWLIIQELRPRASGQTETAPPDPA
jgi:MFS family permease